MGEYYNDFRSCKTLEDLKLKLNRFFESFFSKIDSLNVVSLNTNITTISSGDGTTIIDGAVIKQYDPLNTLRLAMGNGGSDFGFNLYNKIGTPTISLNASTGNVSITGDINMLGGSISWANVNTDPVATDAYNTANSAYSAAGSASSTANSALTKAQQIANGTYSGGTFINGTLIYAPTISGGSLSNTGTYTRTYIDSTGITFKDSSARTKLSLFVEYDSNPNLQFKNNSNQTATLYISDSEFGLLNSAVPFYISGAATVSGKLTAHTFEGNTITGANDLYLESGSGGAVMLNNLSERNVRVGGGSSYVGFYGATGVQQQTATYMGSLATTETAGGTYSSNEQNMLTHIKSDLGDLRVKVNGILSKFDNLNLLAVT